MRFYKYQGTGNDFIIFDDRNQFFKLGQKQMPSYATGASVSGQMALCSCKMRMTMIFAWSIIIPMGL